MPADYIILAVVAFLSISGSLFLLRQARKRRRQHFWKERVRIFV